MLNFNAFRIFYFFGFFAIAVLIFGAPYFSIPNLLIVFLGVGHVVCLAIWASTLEKKREQLAAGYRVQTAGYLHTLIGFTGALFQLNGRSDSAGLLQAISAPLSYALLTSVVGWLFGGEIVNNAQEQVEEEEKISLEEEAKKISRELKKFGDSISSIYGNISKKIEAATQKFEDSLDRVSASYERIFDEQTNFLNKIKEKQDKLIQDLDKYQENFLKEHGKLKEQVDNNLREYLKLSEQLKVIIDNLRAIDAEGIYHSINSLKTSTDLAAGQMYETANASEKVAKYLQEGQILIDQLEALLDRAAKIHRG